jgi:hypothetical protein
MADTREMFINAQALLAVEGLPQYLQAAARMTAERGLYGLGTYIQALSDEQLSALSQAMQLLGSEEAHQSELTLLVLLLVNAEGSALRMSESTTPYLRKLYLLAQAEAFRRRGLVRLDYRKVSLLTFDPEMVEPTELARRQGLSVRVEQKGRGNE